MTMIWFRDDESNIFSISSNNDEEKTFLDECFRHFEEMMEEDCDEGAVHAQWNHLCDKHRVNQLLMAEPFQRWINSDFASVLKEINATLNEKVFYLHKGDNGVQYWWNNVSIDALDVTNRFVSIPSLGDGVILSKKNNHWLMAHFKHDGGLNMRWELREYDITTVERYSYLEYRVNGSFFKDLTSLFESLQPEIEAFNAKHMLYATSHECELY